MKSIIIRAPPFVVIALSFISQCLITTSQAVDLYDFCSNPPCFLSRGVPIQYPFGIGSRGCGHIDFQVECDTGFSDTAVLNIKGRNYTTRMAFYNENTLNVLDIMVRRSPCYVPNASVDFTGSPFEIASHYFNLTYLLNCSEPIKGYSQIDCANTSYLGFSDFKASNSCGSVFQVPIQEVEPSDFTGNLSQEFNLWQMRMLLRKGFWIKWDELIAKNDNCSSCQSSNGICGYNISDTHKPHGFVCYCKDRTHPKNCFNGGGTEKRIIIGSCIGGLAALVAATVLLVLFVLWRKKVALATKNASGDLEFDLAETGHLPIFSYRELEQATNFFDDKRELGDGGYGKVYLGKLQDGRSVAVKRFHENNDNRVQQFINEVRILSSARHCNLVRLFGYCKEPENLLLVYEYVPNGTLFDHLHREKRGNGLQWDTRLKIALETANALAYLHFDINPPIFHRDVKSANILLDENMGVKLADFGLSRLVPQQVTHVSTIPQGTPGYVDPDYHQFYKLTDKSDVYSFGVVLIEIISGKKAVDELRDGREISLAHLARTKIQNGALQELVDPDLIEFECDDAVKEMITRVAELAFLCLSVEKDDRPCMKEVVTQLHRIKQVGYGCVNCRNIALGDI